MLSPIGIKVKSENEPDLDPLKRFEGRKGGYDRCSLPLGRYAWSKRISPFAPTRLVGKCGARILIRKFVDIPEHIPANEKQALRDYLFHVYCRKGAPEAALMVNFDFSLQPYLPLGSDLRLGNPNFPIPLSFIYGENDWARIVDQDFAKNIVSINNNKFKNQSHLRYVPDSDHNSHLDNPQALANLIINDIFNADLPVLSREAQATGGPIQIQEKNLWTHPCGIDDVINEQGVAGSETVFVVESCQNCG